MIRINGKIVDFGSFPNNEINLPIDLLVLKSYNEVSWMYEDDIELFQLALLKDFIDSRMLKAYLDIHYMPHSRMDRANESYWFSLKTATKLINDMKWEYVHVVEPHSDVTPALLDRSFTVDWCIAKIKYVVERTGATSLFFPDAGAAKRYTYDMLYAVGNKRRDFKTGNIVDFSLSGEVHEKVLIVDDMCSRGGTFIHSADLLIKNGAKINGIYLLVAYCEPTIFEGDIFSRINTVFTSKEIQLTSHDNIVKI